jgi:hypothetical protein
VQKKVAVDNLFRYTGKPNFERPVCCVSITERMNDPWLPRSIVPSIFKICPSPHSVFFSQEGNFKNMRSVNSPLPIFAVFQSASKHRGGIARASFDLTHDGQSTAAATVILLHSYKLDPWLRRSCDIDCISVLATV